MHRSKPKPNSEETDNPGSTSPANGRSQQPKQQLAQFPGRMLHRAAALVTTRGEPVPAIAETLFKLESQSPAPLTSTADSSTRYISTDGIQSLDSQLQATTLTRRRSESSATSSISLSGIRRGFVKVKDVSVTVVRRGSFKRQKSSASAGEKSIGDPPSINEAGSASSAAPSSSSSPRPPSLPPTFSSSSSSESTKGKKPHRRSFSDVSWIRPKFWSNTTSEPTIPTIREERERPALSINADTAVSPIQEHFSPFHSPSEPSIVSRTTSAPTTLVITSTNTAATMNAITTSSTTTKDEKGDKMEDLKVPGLLQFGVPMLKVSARKQKTYTFKLDPDQGRIVWESKLLRISESPPSLLFLPYFLSLSSFPHIPNPHICLPPLMMPLSSILTLIDSCRSTHREHQGTSLRRRRSLLPRTLPALSGLRIPLAYHCLRSRRGLQNPSPYRPNQRCLPNLGYHPPQTL